MTEEQPFHFHIEVDSTPVMSIGPDGRFYVKGVEVKTTEEIRDTFLTWCQICLEKMTTNIGHLTFPIERVSDVACALADQADHLNDTASAREYNGDTSDDEVAELRSDAAFFRTLVEQLTS